MKKIEMNIDREAFEHSIVVTFDKRDIEEDDIVAVGGYVQVRQRARDFQVLVCNKDGDVVMDTSVPFDFKSVEDI
jgi:hypothetical protein